MNEKEETKQNQNPSADELTACQKERDEYLAGWQRAKADLINYKKEEESRFTSTIVYSTAQLIKEFLPAIDSFTFARESVQGDAKAEKGITTIQSQFQEVLKKLGVTQIETKKGDEFDPSKHEAMMQVDLNENEKELDGKVIEVLVPGYSVSGHVIRAVKVKVGKTK